MTQNWSGKIKIDGISMYDIMKANGERLSRALEA